MSDKDPTQMTVAELKEELKSRGISRKGNKVQLVRRLQAAVTEKPAEASASTEACGPESTKQYSMDLYDCNICLENMLDRDPRLLSCHHSFCYSCLCNLLKQEQIICPTCREATVVTKGEVSSLKVNFTLRKVQEHIDHVFSKKVILCQLCRSTKAELKCQECIQLLCEGCSQKHNKLKTFAGHNLYKLCPDHAEGMVTHLCVKCVSPACFNCVMTKHLDHEADVMGFRDGLTHLLIECEETQKKIGIHSDVLKIHIETKMAKIHSAEELIGRAKKIQAYHLQKAEKAKRTIKKVEVSIDTAKKLIKKHEVKKHTANELATLLDYNKTQIKAECLGQYLSTRDKSNLHLKEEIEQFEFPNFFLEDPTLKEDITNGIPEQITYFPEPILVKTFRGNWKCPWRVSEVSTNSVIVTDYENNSVTILSLTGSPNTILPLHEGYGTILDAKIYEQKLYLFYNKQIVVKNFVTKELVEEIAHGLSDFRVGLVLTKSKFAFLCRNSVQVLDADTKLCKTVISNLPCPVSLAKNPHDEKAVSFAVTDIQTHKTYIYDYEWNLEQILGEMENIVTFTRPYDTTFTSDGILVADAENKHVCQFSLSGRYIKSINFGEDITKVLVSILYKKPHLWVAQADYPPIKCFQICEAEK